MRGSMWRSESPLGEGGKTPAIHTQDLTRRFGKTVAVDHLNLTIAEGEIFGFLGPNGAGKSTTIRMLVGVLLPSEGEAWVAGYSVLREIERIKPLIGYMSQQFGLYQDLTVWENLEFFARIYLGSSSAVKRSVEEVLETLDLTPYVRVKAAHLSGGWKQRLALACAIVHRPRILFLDEPTAGIDPVARRSLWDYLYSLASKGTTLFVTTHYMEEAERCHRIGFMWQGRLVACNTPQGIKQLLSDYTILSVQGTPSMRLVEEARKIPGVEDAHLYGNDAHLILHRDAIPEKVLSSLEEKGITLHSSQRILPSIEDVFVSLSRKSPA